MFEKREGLVKYGCCSKKGCGVQLTIRLAYFNIPFYSYPAFCVCALCVLVNYTVSIGIICGCQEGLSPVKSNQQIYNFCK